MCALKTLVYVVFTALSGRYSYNYTSEEAELGRRPKFVQVYRGKDYNGNMNIGDHS